MTFEIDLKGRRGVVFGIANRHSIAWAVTKRLHDAGVDLALSYFGERLKDNVTELAGEIGASIVEECDVTNRADVDRFYARVKAEWGDLDYIVHSVAFAHRGDLGGRFSDVSVDGFRLALETSAYSLVAVVAGARDLFGERGGSVITMTFDASVKVYPGYNIMGTAKAALENEVRQLAAEYGPDNVRVNALSPGPLTTLSARGVPGLNDMKKAHRERSPLRRNISHDEVAQAGLFLLSDMSSGITGVVLPVDAGYGILA